MARTIANKSKKATSPRLIMTRATRKKTEAAVALAKGLWPAMRKVQDCLLRTIEAFGDVQNYSTEMMSADSGQLQRRITLLDGIAKSLEEAHGKMHSLVPRFREARS